MNWLLLRGFERYGLDEQADRMRQATLELVRQQGFFEYFHPTAGTGHGSDLFSWTASLLLDILLDEAPKTNGKTDG